MAVISGAMSVNRASEICLNIMDNELPFSAFVGKNNQNILGKLGEVQLEPGSILAVSKKDHCQRILTETGIVQYEISDKIRFLGHVAAVDKSLKIIHFYDCKCPTQMPLMNSAKLKLHPMRSGWSQINGFQNDQCN